MKHSNVCVSTAPLLWHHLMASEILLWLTVSKTKEIFDLSRSVLFPSCQIFLAKHWVTFYNLSKVALALSESVVAPSHYYSCFPGKWLVKLNKRAKERCQKNATRQFIPSFIKWMWVTCTRPLLLFPIYCLLFSPYSVMTQLCVLSADGFESHVLLQFFHRKKPLLQWYVCHNDHKCNGHLSRFILCVRDRHDSFCWRTIRHASST